MKKIYVAIAAIFVSVPIFAQQWNWFFEPLPVEDTDLGTYAYAKGITSDANGNVYINWLSEHPSITIGNETFNGSSYIPGRNFLIKLNAAGAIQWINATAPSDRLATNAIVSDADGTIYTASEISGTYNVQNYAFDTQNAIYNAIVSKTSTNGELVWVKNFSITGDPADQDAYINRFIRPYSLALDPLGNVYVCGLMRGIAGIFGNITKPVQGSEDIFLAKLNSSGDVEWVTTAAQSNYQGPLYLSCDSGGSIYLSGSYKGNQALQFGQATIEGNNIEHVYLVKYNPDGDVVWVKSHGGLVYSNYCFATGITVDGADNIYLGGILDCPSIMFDNYNITTPPGVANQGFIVKYNNEGIVQWANGIGSYSFMRDLKADDDGSLYTLGNFYSNQVTLGNIVLTNESGSNGYIAKLDTNGNYLWAEHIGGTGQAAMKMDLAKADNTLCVSGNYSNIRLGTQVFNAPINGNLFAAKFTPQTLSTPDHQINNTMVFPNPASNFLHINIDQDTEYTVVDMNGRMVNKGVTKQGDVDVLSLAKGIYTIITNGTSTKFIKE